MKATIRSTFPLPLKDVRALTMRPTTMQTIAHPVLKFSPVQPKELPDEWKPNEVYRVNLCSLQIIPLGWYDIKITIEEDTPTLCVARDRGHGRFITIWDHVITLERRGDETAYTDSVDVHAGILTPLVYVFAQFFYRHRQRRWKKIIIPAYRA